MNNTSQKVIKPLIQQHVGDAAFYWQIINDGDLSPIISEEKRIHFIHLLNAHLDGLIIAKDIGWKEAYKSLNRWKTDGEAFVCGILAHQSKNIGWLNECLDLIKQSPDTTLQGYTAALTYLPYELVEEYLNKLQDSHDNINICILLNSLAGHQKRLPSERLDNYLQYNHTTVKLATCRYIQSLKLKNRLPHLYRLNDDDDLLIKQRAAIAICWLSFNDIKVVNMLQQTILSYVNTPTTLGGLDELLYQLQLEELVRVAGQVYSVHPIDPLPLLDILPSYLKILFLGHYGKSKYLTYLLDLLNNEELCRLAFWAIHMITGLDIYDSTYLIQTEENDSTTTPINKHIERLVTGIDKPDKHAIGKVCKHISLMQDNVLLGKPITEQSCKYILQQGNQVERYIASWHLYRLNSEIK